jgi:hypothetical protein
MVDEEISGRIVAQKETEEISSSGCFFGERRLFL